MNGRKYPREWEQVNKNMQRMRVLEGWIVRTSERIITGDKFYVNSEALIFLYDEAGLWVLEKE